jgi:hypothetical protein
MWQEASRHFRKKKREYLKDKIKKLESDSKNKNIRDLYRGTNEFKKVYQLRTNMKVEMDDLLVDLHKILNRWKNYFCQLLNVHEADGDRQTKMHTAEPVLPESSAFGIEAATGKMKGYKLPGSDHIPAKPIQARRKILHSEIHKLTELIWKKELPHQWNESTAIRVR